MADPTPYKRSYSFTNHQEDAPDTPLPGNRVDIELDNIAEHSEALVRRVNAGLKVGLNQEQLEIVADNIDVVTFVGVNIADIRAAPLAATAAAEAAIDAENSAVLAAASAVSASGSAEQAADSATVAQAARTGAEAARDEAQVATSRLVPTLASLLAGTQSYPTGTVVVALAEGYSYQVDPTDFDLTNSGGVRFRHIPNEGGIIYTRAIGVKADGTTDDTLALRAAVVRAQALVRNAETTKQQDGADVVLPKGLTLITDTITVTESNIRVRGISASTSAIYAPNANFDLLVFERPGWALYNCGVSDLRFLTPGNATAGFCLKIMNCIYFNHKDTLFNGAWGGLYIAAGGKVTNSNVIWSQEVRNLATPLTGPSVNIGGEYAIPGDIHFTDCQVMNDVATAGVNSVIIRCGDGIYWDNCHMHGTTLVEPRGINGETTLSTLVFSECYFDASRDVNVIFGGTVTSEYRDIRLDNCYVRAGVIGVRFASTTIIDGVKILGGTIAQCQEWGVEFLNDNVRNFRCADVTFEDNNKQGLAEVGDILLGGSGSKVVSCDFSKGVAAGHSVRVRASATNAQLRGLDWTHSDVAVATRVVDLSTSTRKSDFVGFPIKSKGSLVVPSGAMVAHIAHGLAVTPGFADITVKPAGELPKTPWTSNPNSTQFTIEFGAALPAARTVAWEVNTEN